MDSKYQSTKRLEKDGKTPAPTKKQALLEDSRGKLLSNIQDKHKNGESLDQVEPGKKKAGNDIIKKNKNLARPPTGKRTVQPNMGGGLDSVNIADGGANYTLAEGAGSMFDQKPPAARAVKVTNVTKKDAVPAKNPRQVILDDLKALHEKPDPKKLKLVKARCEELNVNFDQYNARAKEEQMKDKAKKQREKAAKVSGVDARIEKRRANGNKLIEKLQAKEDPAPYADSIMLAARYNKMRVLEALISFYDDNSGLRAERANETHPGTGRHALHYLSYMANTDMIQMLSCIDGLKMNILDGRDRTCLHYAVIRGKSKLISTLLLLFKTHGGKFQRSVIDPEAKAATRVPNEFEKLDKLDDLNKDIEKKRKDEGLEDDEAQEEQEEEQEEEEKQSNMEETKGEEDGENQPDPECPEEQDNKGVEEQPPEATEFGESEQEFADKMMREMDHSDTVHVGEEVFFPEERDESNPEKGGHAQVSMKSLINFRDHKGRTALHIAAIWKNKVAVETLLQLKANPLIEDGQCYRPVDYADPTSAIADLLKNAMYRATPPTLTPFGEYEQSIKSGAAMKQKMVNQVEAKQKGVKPVLGLDLVDIKPMSHETLQNTRLGATKDSYYQACIKAKKLDAAIYLKTDVGGFPITYQNAIGNTVIHNAVMAQGDGKDATSAARILKLVIMEKHAPEFLENVNTLSDIAGKGNLKQNLAKALLLQNAKGMTPLAYAVDYGGSLIFKMLVDLYQRLQNQSANNHTMLKALGMKDQSVQGDTILIKAMRKERYDMVNTLLALNSEKYLKYDEVLTKTDLQSGRNILHHAVIKGDNEIVKRLIYLDSDHGKLRSQKDFKEKTPQVCDDKGQFKDLFETLWDVAKKGNTERLKQMVQVGATEEEAKKNGKYSVNDKTPWLQNTALHVAVKAKQIKVVKILVWDMKCDTQAKNINDQTAADYCKKFVKEEDVKSCIMGLLTKMHQNTVVVKNIKAKQEAREQKLREYEEMQQLRKTLKMKIEKKGMDIAKMFKMFDTDGSGSFNQTEFEAAFLALGIDFKVAQLRQLIAYSDKNMDGSIDFKEFHDMLYAPDPEEEQNAMIEAGSDGSYSD